MPFSLWIGPLSEAQLQCSQVNEAQTAYSVKWQISLFEGQPEKVALPDFVKLLMRDFFPLRPF